MGGLYFIHEAMAETFDFIDNAFPEIIRPPGALPEAEFLEKCLRCGACIRACRHFAIKDYGSTGSFDEGTPRIIPGESWCRMCDDFPCTAACPSGALLHKPGSMVKIGTAEIYPTACIRSAGSTCNACIDACPEMFSAIKDTAEGDPPAVDAEACCGCGACESACPACPEKGIRITAPE